MKQVKPTTPGRRFYILSDRASLAKAPSLKNLLVGKKRISGRNTQGRITVRRRGAGHKRKYRIMDFRRDKLNVEGKIKFLEYDPNRTAFIALVSYMDGEKRYMLAPHGVGVGDQVIASETADIVAGNALPLRSIPTGTLIHNVELRPKKGGQLVRSAGSVAQLIAKEEKYALIRMASGQVKKVFIDCWATVGQVSHIDHVNRSIGKAGRSRWKGIRPHVRGVAMNPVDHPLGGGEGKTSGGRHPCTPWGKPTKGFKTRNNRRTDFSIIRNRKV